jgi:hypothetical protein
MNSVVSLMRGEKAADALLQEVACGTSAPEALLLLVRALQSDPAALRGALRRVQKSIERQSKT